MPRRHDGRSAPGRAPGRCPRRSPRLGWADGRAGVKTARGRGPPPAGSSRRRTGGTRPDADPRTWTRAEADVDGHAIVLWFHRRPEGFAAVADMGLAVLLVHGQVPPDVWVFSLACPEQARAVLDRSRRAGQLIVP